MTETPRGHAITSDVLRDMGVSRAIASYMVRAGWLSRLSQGAYLLAGDTITRDGAIAFAHARVPGLHVGGLTALTWQAGARAPVDDVAVELWGNNAFEFPDWVRTAMPVAYQTTQLFDSGLTTDFGVALMVDVPRAPDVPVSVPERALLELASDIGKSVTLDRAMQVVCDLPDLRSDVLDELLLHCKRVKVIRLVRDLGYEAGHSWTGVTHSHVERLGAGKRWSNRTRNGEHLTLKSHLSAKRGVKGA